MNPLLLFLLLFVGIPLFELYWLIQVGAQIGALPTILLTIFTAILGGTLVRLQGFTTLLRVNAMMQRGEMPAIEIIEGLVLLLCGIMLLLPGFFTDAIGFLLLVPPLRRLLIVQLLRRASILHPVGRPPGQSGPGGHHDVRVIEGECRRDE